MFPTDKPVWWQYHWIAYALSLLKAIIGFNQLAQIFFSSKEFYGKVYHIVFKEINLLNALLTLIKFELFFKYFYKSSHIRLFQPWTCDIALERGGVEERGRETEKNRTENRS